MQSSISVKLPRFVSFQSRLRARTITSCSWQRYPEFVVLQPEYDNPRYSNRDRQSSSLNNNRRPFRIRTSEQQTQRTLPRRIHSTLASKSFWRGLHQAVRQGNGSLAEEIAEQVLQDYYRLTTLSSTPSSDTIDPFHPHNDNLPPLLDSQIFSLVLQAWKNSDCASLHSALRAHNLLIQMAALADQDVLCDPPVLDDYLAVLECWHQAASLNNNNNEDEFNTTSRKNNNNQNGNIALVLQHAEEIWNQMKERQRRETMTKQTPRFAIDEKAHELFASLLAKAGKASRAEQIVGEAVAQQLGRNVKRYSFPASTTPERGVVDSSSNSSNNNNNSDCRDDEYDPRVGLNLCHAVLEAHLRSKETKASERAEAFLQKMRTDQALPNPDVESYNLVLERWMDSSKASRNNDATVRIANKVEKLIHQMKEEDRIQPNLVSYQYGIDVLARSGHAIRAETMLANLVKDYFLQYDADLKPTITPFQSVLWAYSKAATQGPARDRLANAAEKAESILNNMKDLSTLLDTHPTVWSYNIVLKCWAHSRSPDAASRTTALYKQLQQQPSYANDNDNNNIDNDNNGNNERMNFEQESGDSISGIVPPTDLKPDATSMNTVLNVLSINEGAVRTEQKLLEFYEAHIREPQRNPSPDTIAFSTTINAWSKSSDRNAPDRAHALLRKLIGLYNSEGKKIHKPDIVTYTNVMQCWIKSKKPEAPEKVESILRELQDMEYDGDATMKPDAACWNSVISAWAAVGNGERAEAVFVEMVDASLTSGGASPTSITLTNVLKAWTQTKSHKASDRAMELLETMEEWYEDGMMAVKPNVVNYSVVLDCLAYARKSSAAERAERMLQRMVDSDDPNVRPNVVSYNCVIKAWSYARDPRSANRITSVLRDLIDQSESNPKMRPNENTFGTILKFLADSDLPDKAKRARAIENLMNMFLEREPKQWIKKELRRCLSSREIKIDTDPTCVSAVDTLPESFDEKNDHSKEINGAYDRAEAEHEKDTTTSAGSCRGKRANNRFNSEIKLKNLVRKPLTGKPEPGHDFVLDDHDNNQYQIRDALVRVRLIGETTFDESKHRTLDKSNNSNHAFSLIVVDGDGEYSCKVLDVDKNYAPEIKGGQFLNISYYWCRGQPVIVKMQDSINGIEISK
jgi:pentatricopeptide repeat protein